MYDIISYFYYIYKYYYNNMIFIIFIIIIIINRYQLVNVSTLLYNGFCLFWFTLKSVYITSTINYTSIFNCNPQSLIVLTLKPMSGCEHNTVMI
jgi:hypothetical protein